MRLWFDVEDLFYFSERSSRLTGIQRLTGELYSALVERYPGEVGFVRHALDDGVEAFEVVDWSAVREVYAWLKGDEARDDISAQGANDGPRKVEVTSFLRRLARRFSAERAEPPAVAPTTYLHDIAKPDGVLCAFGAPWLDARYPERVARFKQATGSRFAMLIHDLIPLLRPEYFETGRSPNFGRVMTGALPQADFIFTNSKATADDVVSWAHRQGLGLHARPRHVPIGTGFCRPSAGKLPAPLTAGNYVLFVSTIEVRKNHAQAFRVWRRMLEEMPRDKIPTLVFAGTWGWMVDDLKKAIASTSDLDGKLVVVEAPDDATLSALYEGCLFTLFLSYYEGWGLPVSDSLAFGKVCVASERTSMPEAGGEFCVYVDPDNTTAAFERIRSLIENPGELDALEHRLRSSFRPTSWSETADEIWDAVTACASSIPARRRPVARDLVL